MSGRVCSDCGTTEGPFVADEYASSGMCGPCLWGDAPLPLGYSTVPHRAQTDPLTPEEVARFLAAPAPSRVVFRNVIPKQGGQQ